MVVTESGPWRKTLEVYKYAGHAEHAALCKCLRRVSQKTINKDFKSLWKKFNLNLISQDQRFSDIWFPVLPCENYIIRYYKIFSDLVFKYVVKCILNRDKGKTEVCDHWGLCLCLVRDEKWVLSLFQSHVHSKEVIVACTRVSERSACFHHNLIWVNESEGANQVSEQLFLVLN